MRSKVMRFALRNGAKLGLAYVGFKCASAAISNVLELREVGKDTWLENKRRQWRHAVAGCGLNWGFGHTGVTVSDFNAAVQFYDRVFGMKLMNYLEISGDDLAPVERLYHCEGLRLVKLGFLSSKSGNVLEIFEFDPPLKTSERETWNRPSYTHVAFNVTNVKAWVHRLRREGLEQMCEPQRVAGADWVFFRDPDGNLVELIDLHATRLALGRLGPILGKVMKHTTLASFYRN